MKELSSYYIAVTGEIFITVPLKLCAPALLKVVGILNVDLFNHKIIA